MVAAKLEPKFDKVILQRRVIACTRNLDTHKPPATGHMVLGNLCHLHAVAVQAEHTKDVGTGGACAACAGRSI